jgi:uncharacterized membrane protein
MTRTFPSAALVALAAVAAGLAALVPAPAWLGIIALPLVLFLPGLALGAAIFRAPPPWTVRLPLSIALSLAVCVVGGFGLHLIHVGLAPESWIPMLVGVTVAAAAVAWRRGWTSERSVSEVLAWSSSRPSLRGAMFVVPAVMLAVLAIGLARTPLPAEGARGYTALSIAPAGTGAQAIELGLTSAEFDTTSYRLELHAGGRVALNQRITLQTGQEWNAVIDVTSIPRSRRSFEVLLYKLDQPKTLYRRVTLTLPGSTLPPATAVWLLPGRGTTDTVRTIVASAEPKTETFVLEIRAAGRLLRTQRLTIEPGARLYFLTSISSIPESLRTFEALLYRDVGDRSSPYRRATLDVTP